MNESFSFDATQHTPAQDMSDPLPAGWYPMEVTGTTLKRTKAGTGTILEVEYTVVDGEGKGRKVWTGFNVQNPNEDAERIAKEQLSALCHATGVLKIKAHEQLRGKRCLVRVVVKTQEGYDPKNEAKGWKEYTPVARPAARPAPVRATVPARDDESFPSALNDTEDDLPF